MTTEELYLKALYGEEPTDDNGEIIEEEEDDELIIA